ncbi:hypothetical protein V8F06_013303, partial [Rhypophila decipiens]
MSNSEEETEVPPNVVANFSRPVGPPPPRPRRPSFYQQNPSLAPSPEFMSSQDASRSIANYTAAQASSSGSSSPQDDRQLIVKYNAAQTSSSGSRSRLPAPISPVAQPRVHLPPTQRTNASPGSVKDKGIMPPKESAVAATAKQDREGEGKSGPEKQPKTPVRLSQQMNLTLPGSENVFPAKPKPAFIPPNIVFNPTPKLRELPKKKFQALVKRQSRLEIKEPPKSHFSPDSSNDESTEREENAGTQAVRRISSGLSLVGAQVKNLRQEMEDTVQKLSDQASQLPEPHSLSNYLKNRKSFTAIPGQSFGSSFEPAPATPSKDPRAVPSTDPRAAPSKNPRAVPSKDPRAGPSQHLRVGPSQHPRAGPSQHPRAVSSKDPRARVIERHAPTLSRTPVMTVYSTPPIHVQSPTRAHVPPRVPSRLRHVQSISDFHESAEISYTKKNFELVKSQSDIHSEVTEITKIITGSEVEKSDKETGKDNAKVKERRSFSQLLKGQIAKFRKP